MKAEINWLDNPEVFRVNQLPAHSDHIMEARKNGKIKKAVFANH